MFGTELGLLAEKIGCGVCSFNFFVLIFLQKKIVSGSSHLIKRKDTATWDISNTTEVLTLTWTSSVGRVKCQQTKPTKASSIVRFRSYSI